MPMLGQSAQMEQCKLAVQVCTITKFNKQEGNIMAKTIYEKIMTRKITSVELKSVLGREFYTYASGKKKAAVLILSHSELFDYGCIPVMYPSTSELTLLWKGSKKLKNALLVPIKGPDYELTVNLFTGEVVDYMDMDIIEGNF